MNRKLRHHWNVSSRREFFSRAGSGLGAIALGSMLAEGAETPKKTHFPAKAKSVIWLFMEGGPSHIDMYDERNTETSEAMIYIAMINLMSRRLARKKCI